MTSSDRSDRPDRRSGDPRRDLYSRFIPREELSSFAAWSVGDVSGAGEAGRESAPFAGSELLRAGRRATDRPAADAQQAVAEQLRAARQSGYQDGYRDGLVALEGFKQSFAQQTTAQVAAIVHALHEQLDQVRQEMAQALVESCLSIGRTVLRSELAARPECIAEVAEHALEALSHGARHVTLRVHPDDHALIGGSAAEAIATRGARLLADSAIARGGCIVDADIGRIDATIEDRWRRAAAGLGRDYAWHPPAPSTGATVADADAAANQADAGDGPASAAPQAAGEGDDDRG